MFSTKELRAFVGFILSKASGEAVKDGIEGSGRVSDGGIGVDGSLSIIGRVEAAGLVLGLVSDVVVIDVVVESVLVDVEVVESVLVDVEVVESVLVDVEVVESLFVDVEVVVIFLTYIGFLL